MVNLILIASGTIKFFKINGKSYKNPEGEKIEKAKF